MLIFEITTTTTNNVMEIEYSTDVWRYTHVYANSKIISENYWKHEPEYGNVHVYKRNNVYKKENIENHKSSHLLQKPRHQQYRH